MLALIRYFPTEPDFKFMRFRRICFPFSAIISIISILLFFNYGLHYGIDFKGGTLIEVKTLQGPADLANMRERLSSLGLGEVQLQQFGSPSDVLIRLQSQEGGEQAQQEAVQKIRSTLGDQVEYRRVEVVGPRVSGELVQAGVAGVVISIIAVLIYLWFRFEWQFAFGAIIATLHDLVLTIGFYAVTQLDFDLSSVAAILTIVGYSLNDTVVVYDRVREMLRRYKKMSIHDLLDYSINSTLSRTTMTAVTTALALVALWLIGSQVIQSFVQAMLFGVIIGTYSSIFIAAPVLIYLGLRTSGEGEKKA